MFFTLPVWSQPVNFESVVIQQPVVRGEDKGLAIIPRLTIRGKVGQKFALNAYLYDENRNPLLAKSGPLRTSTGQIAVARSFEAGSGYTLYDGLQDPANALFIPYNQLQLARGQYLLQVQLQLFDSESNQLLQTSNFATFTYQAD